MTIDIRLLRQVLALSKHRNFARAAESLHISQPALSRSIAGSSNLSAYNCLIERQAASSRRNADRLSSTAATKFSKRKKNFAARFF